MSCKKANFLTDINLLGKISLHLDNTDLRLNDVVKVIRNDSDALRDALSTKDGAWSMFKDWKNKIYYYGLISPEQYAKLSSDGDVAFTVHTDPEKAFYKEITELDKIVLNDASFKFTEENFNHYAYQVKPQLKKLFSSEAEFYEYMNARYSILSTLEEQGHDIRKHFALRHKPGADYMRILISDMEQGEILSVIKTQPSSTSLEGYAESLKKSIYEALPETTKTESKQAHINAFVDFMVPTGLTRTPAIKAVEGIFNFTRPLAMFAKFNLGVMSGMRLFFVSAVGNSLMLNARTQGLDAIIKSNFIEDLLEKEGILAGESRLKINQEFGQSWMEQLLQMAMAVHPNSSVTKQTAFGVASKLLGGWHNMWDILADSYAKKAMVAEAMAVNGINGYNIDMLYDLYKKGELPKELIDDIRRLAHDKYDSFFTNSSTRSRTANRFTVGEKDGMTKTITKLAFNFMQGYTTRRLGALVSAFEMFHIAKKEGRVKFTDPDSIRRWLNTEEGSEMRSFIMTSLLSAKLATYVVTNQAENSELSMEERLAKIKNFAMAFNDYLSSTESSVPFRMLDSMMQGVMTKYEKLDPDGVTREYYGGVEAGVYNTLMTTSQMIGREFNVFGLVPALIAGAQTSAGWDFALESFDTQMNKILNGQGRFLMDGTDNPYGLTIPQESYDATASWAFVTGENNKVLNLSNRIRNIEDISRYMEQPLGLTVLDAIKTIAPLSVLKQFFDSNSIINKEASLNMMMNYIEKDKIANDLYNGTFNSSVILTEAEALAKGLPKREGQKAGNVESLFKDLTSFSNIRPQSDGTLELGSDYGINDTQFEAIEQQIINQIGPQTYHILLSSLAEKPNDQQMAMIRAAMDAKVPGSGRILLSTVAYKEYQALKKKAYPKQEPTFEQQEEMQRAILMKYGNQMLLGDQLAQNKMLMERLEQINPAINNFSPEFQKIANSVLFTDSIIHEQVKSGNINARYLGSVLSLAGKYTPESVRLPIIKKTLYGIDQMDISEEEKRVLKTGVGLGNVDFLRKLAQDPSTKSSYKDTVKDVLSMIYTNQNASSTSPNHLDIESTSTTKIPYSKTYGKGSGNYVSRSSGAYGTSSKTGFDEEGNSTAKYASENAKAREILSKKLVGMPHFNRNTKIIQMSSLPTSNDKNRPKNKLEEFYIKELLANLGTAESEKLENSKDMSNISKQSKPASGKIGYKSKKWKTSQIQIPRARKARPIAYKK